MSQRICFFILFSWLLALPAAALSFTYTYEGYTLRYTVSKSSSSYCEVAPQNTPFFEGNLVIPAEVSDSRNKTYKVTGIGDLAFYNCKNLTSVTIPNTVKTIGMKAFGLCSKLTSVTLGSSVTTIDESAFDRSTNLAKIEVNANNPKYSSVGGALYNKDASKIVCLPCGFSGSYELPGSVTSIGSKAFHYCNKLTEVTIPNSVTSIGDYAFSGCSGLTSMSLPNSVTSIGNAAFADCSNLTTVNLPNTVTAIGGTAFSGCISLTSINIPNSVTSINSSTFHSCKKLATVTIPNSVTSIDNSAFSNCSSLTLIDIPNSVTSIGNSAFSGCSGLTSVVIPPSVTSIGSAAFAGCTALIDFDVKSTNPNYTSIDGILFSRDLKTIHTFPAGKSGYFFIPEFVTTINDYAFSGCSGMTAVNIPNSVTSIGKYAFQYCTGLTTLKLPNALTTIEEGLFKSDANLTSVTIPASVTAIGKDAFDCCSGMTRLICYALNPPVCGPNALTDINKKICTLWLPLGGVGGSYIGVDQWKDFIVDLFDPAQDIINGIQTVSTDKSDAPIFDLQGRRIASDRNLTPGIYIINGKKTLIR